jgi:hypothetical protein
MTSALFCDITLRRVIIVYRRFGKAYRSYFHGSGVKEEKYSTLEDVTDTLSRNVGKQLPHDAA